MKRLINLFRELREIWDDISAESAVHRDRKRQQKLAVAMEYLVEADNATVSGDKLEALQGALYWLIMHVEEIDERIDGSVAADTDDQLRSGDS